MCSWQQLSRVRRIVCETSLVGEGVSVQAVSNLASRASEWSSTRALQMVVVAGSSPVPQDREDHTRWTGPRQASIKTAFGPILLGVCVAPVSLVGNCISAVLYIRAFYIRITLPLRAPLISLL